MANDEDFKARLARLAQAPADAPRPPSATCSACDDTGWARHEGKVYACLCEAGQKKPPTIPTIRDVGDAHTLRALFPKGIPSAISGYAVRLEACGVGRAESRYTFDSFAARFRGDKIIERHLNLARLWIDTEPSKRTDLVLFGAHGRGKTGLAVAIARALVERKERLHFVEAEGIATRIRNTYNRHGGGGDWHDPSDRDVETEADVVAELTGIDTLIVDEVTGVKITEFVDDKLRAIVTTRQRNARPTILTLNLPADDANDAGRIEAGLARIFGGALYDRLAERAQFLAMFGPSVRGKK